MPLFREIFRHPLIALCNVLGIALGVAVFLAMQMSNRSANRAFAASVDLVSGKSHAEARASGSGFDETIYPSLRRLPGLQASTPVVEGLAVVPAVPGAYVRVLGMDIFTAPPFQTASFKPEAWQDFDTEAFLSQPGRWVVPEVVAKEFGWKEGDKVAIEANGRKMEVVILRVVPASAIEGSASASSGNRLVLMDIGWAQEMFGQQGKLHAVQFMLKDPTQLDAFLLSVASKMAMPPDVQIGAPQNRTSQIQTMIEGFQLNLTALSMVSMLVGVFLVYNTISASTVRRRKEIGILRALGGERSLVMRHFLIEALVLAVPGVVLGLWAGAALAKVLEGGVSQTISSRYMLVQLAGPAIDVNAAIVAGTYGILATLLGALRPAWEAATLDPVVALHPGTVMDSHLKNRRRWLVLALVLLATTPLLSLGAINGYPILAFASCLTCVLAFACLAPWLSSVLASATLRLFPDTGRVFSLATEAFSRSLHRTGLTIAALACSVAMLVGVATMVASFRSTVNDWIAGSMDADLYLSPVANEFLGMTSFVPKEVVEKLMADPRFEQHQGYREEPVVLADYGPTILTAIDASRAARFQFLETGESDPQIDFLKADVCYVNESYARKHRLDVGETLDVPYPGGIARLRIAAIFRDYSDDRGRIFILRENFVRLWNDTRIHSLGLRLREGSSLSPTEVADDLRAELASIGTFSIFTRASLRQKVLEIFDQTFAITGVLRIIAVVVAVLGVVLALLVLAMERAREISILRSLGASAKQVVSIFLVQAGWVGFVAALLGGVCGLFLSILLVSVVNPAFFGWTIPLMPVWSELILLPLWLTAVSILAGLYPAWKASQATIAPALRLE